MHVPKATGELDERLEALGGDDWLEVILELQPPASQPETESRSRAEKIAARKNAFRQLAEPLATLIASCGGEVTGEVWLNNTLRARVPARCLPKLGASDRVSALDVGKKLTGE